MKNKANIQWWDYDVPSLENWDKVPYARLDESDRQYLNELQNEEGFYSELSGKTSASDLLIINAIAEQTHRRILQKYRIKDTLYWPWVVTTIAIIAFIFTLTVLNDRDQKHQSHSKSNKQDHNSQELIAHSDSDQKTPKKIVEDVPEHMSNGPDVEPELPHDNHDDPNVKSTGDDEERNKRQDSNVEKASDRVVDLGTDLAANVNQSKKEDAKQDELEKPLEKKKKNYGERFVSQGRKESSGSRDVSIPLKVSMVRVEQAANYAVYLNSRTKKSSTSNGQISGGESDDQMRVKFAPEDMPQYPGNNDRLESDLEYLIGKYALKKTYEEVVSVMVSFIIDAKGVMKDIKIHGYKTQEIKSSIQKSLAALDPWKKGKKSGKKGSVRYEILISYK